MRRETNKAKEMAEVDEHVRKTHRVHERDDGGIGLPGEEQLDRAEDPEELEPRRRA